jgi:hypothetical protein
MIKIQVKNKKTSAIVKTLASQAIPDELTVGVTYLQFKDLVKEGIPIHGFIGWVEVPLATLDEKVPETFPNATKQVQSRGVDGKFLADNPDTPETDEAWTGEQKKWREYCAFKENKKMALLQIGWRDNNGNRPEVVPAGELNLWIDHFGVDNIYTKSDGKQKIKNEYTPKTDEGMEVL